MKIYTKHCRNTENGTCLALMVVYQFARFKREEFFCIFCIRRIFQSQKQKLNCLVKAAKEFTEGQVQLWKDGNHAWEATQAESQSKSSYQISSQFSEGAVIARCLTLCLLCSYPDTTAIASPPYQAWASQMPRGNVCCSSITHPCWTSEAGVSDSLSLGHGHVTSCKGI